MDFLFISSGDHRSLECSSDDEDEAVMSSIKEFVLQEFIDDDEEADLARVKPKEDVKKRTLNERAASFDERG
jgi:hypothetical protein